jgi:Cytochrome oxidase assembly protein
MSPGAFVAGLDAGHAYNTFPLMGGRVVPEEYAALPGWRNAFENTAAVQFHHRCTPELVTGQVKCGVAPDVRVSGQLTFFLPHRATLAMWQSVDIVSGLAGR